MGLKIGMRRTMVKVPARQIIVDLEHDGRRIDNFLAWTLKGIPRDRIYRMLRSGEVRVNGGRIRQDYRLTTGEVLRLPPVRVIPNEGTGPPESLRAMVRASVLYEDPELLVLNKPARIAVHGGVGIQHGLIEVLRDLRPDAPYIELVHRLDRGTSGCLMIAKRPRFLRAMHDLFRSGAIAKTYLGLVSGHWPVSAGVIKTGLKKNGVRSSERRVCVTDDGKFAETHIEPIEQFENASLVQVQLKTGRTHQIRVHTAFAGHPLAGDDKYGDKDFNRAMRHHGLRDLFLHSYRIEFAAPDSGERISVKAPLPAGLLSVLESLRQDPSHEVSTESAVRHWRLP
ncbi:MAG: RluA family pseudouridine synthase [Chromatiales bacterium]